MAPNDFSEAEYWSEGERDDRVDLRVTVPIKQFDSLNTLSKRVGRKFDDLIRDAVDSYLIDQGAVLRHFLCKKCGAVSPAKRATDSRRCAKCAIEMKQILLTSRGSYELCGNDFVQLS